MRGRAAAAPAHTVRIEGARWDLHGAGGEESQDLNGVGVRKAGGKSGPHVVHAGESRAAFSRGGQAPPPASLDGCPLLGAGTLPIPSNRALVNAQTPESLLALRQIRLFESASAQSPSDPELHVALGVLHHLGRQYGAAVAAFERALQLRPNDYSLWNKLGATLANNSRSAEALAAYQKVGGERWAMRGGRTRRKPRKPWKASGKHGNAGACTRRENGLTSSSTNRRPFPVLPVKLCWLRTERPRGLKGAGRGVAEARYCRWAVQ